MLASPMPWSAAHVGRSSTRRVRQRARSMASPSTQVRPPESAHPARQHPPCPLPPLRRSAPPAASPHAPRRPRAEEEFTCTSCRGGVVVSAMELLHLSAEPFKSATHHNQDKLAKRREGAVATGMYGKGARSTSSGQWLPPNPRKSQQHNPQSADPASLLQPGDEPVPCTICGRPSSRVPCPFQMAGPPAHQCGKQECDSCRRSVAGLDHGGAPNPRWRGL